MGKIKVFIGGSSETRQQTENVKFLIEEMGHEADAWFDSVRFLPSTFTLQDLESAATKYDAAVFVYGEDDVILADETNTKPIPRDNVVLETGLFAGRLGHERILICTVGKPKIPTDMSGITHVPIENLRFLKDKLENWFKSISTNLPAIYKECKIAPRSEMDAMNPLGKRWEHAKEIWLVNFASTTFLTSADVNNDRRINPEWMKLYRKKVEEGCRFKFLITEPNSFADFDASFSKMITNIKKNVENSELITKAYNSLVETTRSDKSIFSPEQRELVEFKVTNVVLPYGLMLVLNENGYEELNHIKVDLYSPFLTTDSERRSFVIYSNVESAGNFKFFEDQVRTLWKSGRTDVKPVTSCELIKGKIIDNVFERDGRVYLTGDFKKNQQLKQIYDRKLEIGILNYNNSSPDKPHYHTYATEYLYVLSGEYEICIEKKYLCSSCKEKCYELEKQCHDFKNRNDEKNKYCIVKLKKGDFFVIPKLIQYAGKSTRDNTRVLFVKSPSLDDKQEIDKELFEDFLELDTGFKGSAESKSAKNGTMCSGETNTPKNKDNNNEN